MRAFFMNILSAVCSIILIILWMMAFVYVLFKELGRKQSYRPSVKFIVRVAIFGALSTILYTVPGLKFSVPFLPSFLEFHFDEIPILIASFAYGPLTGVAIIFIKTLIKLPMTSTLGVGECADFLYSLVFILPAALIYKKHRKFSGTIIGLSVGTITQLLVSMFFTVYVMVPFYMYVMGFSREALLSMCSMANPAITNLEMELGLYGILPFNAIKDAIVIFVTLIVYKSLRRFIENLDIANN